MKVRDVPEEEKSSSHYTLTSLSTGSEGILMANRRIALYIGGVLGLLHVLLLPVSRRESKSLMWIKKNKSVVMTF